jgi:hypothetical protein
MERQPTTAQRELAKAMRKVYHPLRLRGIEVEVIWKMIKIVLASGAADRMPPALVPSMQRYLGEALCDWGILTRDSRGNPTPWPDAPVEFLDGE